MSIFATIFFLSIAGTGIIIFGVHVDTQLERMRRREQEIIKVLGRNF